MYVRQDHKAIWTTVFKVILQVTKLFIHVAKLWLRYETQFWQHFLIILLYRDMTWDIFICDRGIYGDL